MTDRLCLTLLQENCWRPLETMAPLSSGYRLTTRPYTQTTGTKALKTKRHGGQRQCAGRVGLRYTILLGHPTACSSLQAAWTTSQESTTHTQVCRLLLPALVSPDSLHLTVTLELCQLAGIFCRRACPTNGTKHTPAIPYTDNVSLL